MHAVLERLSPDEDGILRRLHSLEQLGAQLAPQLRQLKDEIRKRDRRLDIREPDDRAVVEPVRVV